MKEIVNKVLIPMLNLMNSNSRSPHSPFVIVKQNIYQKYAKSALKVKKGQCPIENSLFRMIMPCCSQFSYALFSFPLSFI